MPRSPKKPMTSAEMKALIKAQQKQLESQQKAIDDINTRNEKAAARDKLISRPIGQQGRGANSGHGGFSLQRTMGLKPKRYQRVQRICKFYAHRFLNPKKTFRQQDPAQLRRVKTFAVQRAPVLAHFRKAWPVDEILKQYLSYVSKSIRKDFTDEAEEEEGPDLDEINEYLDGLANERHGKVADSEEESENGMEIDEIQTEIAKGRVDSDFDEEDSPENVPEASTSKKQKSAARPSAIDKKHAAKPVTNNKAKATKKDQPEDETEPEPKKQTPALGKSNKRATFKSVKGKNKATENQYKDNDEDDAEDDNDPAENDAEDDNPKDDSEEELQDAPKSKASKKKPQASKRQVTPVKPATKSVKSKDRYIDNDYKDDAEDEHEDESQSKPAKEKAKKHVPPAKPTVKRKEQVIENQYEDDAEDDAEDIAEDEPQPKKKQSVKRQDQRIDDKSDDDSKDIAEDEPQPKPAKKKPQALAKPKNCVTPVKPATKSMKRQYQPIDDKSDDDINEDINDDVGDDEPQPKPAKKKPQALAKAKDCVAPVNPATRSVKRQDQPIDDKSDDDINDDDDKPQPKPAKKKPQALAKAKDCVAPINPATRSVKRQDQPIDDKSDDDINDDDDKPQPKPAKKKPQALAKAKDCVAPVNPATRSVKRQDQPIDDKYEANTEDVAEDEPQSKRSQDPAKSKKSTVKRKDQPIENQSLSSPTRKTHQEDYRSHMEREYEIMDQERELTPTSKRLYPQHGKKHVTFDNEEKPVQKQAAKRKSTVLDSASPVKKSRIQTPSPRKTSPKKAQRQKEAIFPALSPLRDIGDGKSAFVPTEISPFRGTEMGSSPYPVGTPRTLLKKEYCPSILCKDRIPAEPHPRLRFLLDQAAKDGKIVAGTKALQICGEIKKCAELAELMPEAKAQGWPTSIDYEALPKRIMKFEEILTSFFSDPTSFDINASWALLVITLQRQRITFAKFNDLDEVTRFQLVPSAYHSGYYGSTGRAIILATIRYGLGLGSQQQLFDATFGKYVAAKLANSQVTSPAYWIKVSGTQALKLEHLLECVLAPYVTELLIQEDLDVNEEEALTIREQSKLYGELRIDNDMDDGSLDDILQSIIHRRDVLQVTCSANKSPQVDFTRIKHKASPVLKRIPPKLSRKENVKPPVLISGQNVPLLSPRKRKQQTTGSQSNIQNLRSEGQKNQSPQDDNEIFNHPSRIAHRRAPNSLEKRRATSSQPDNEMRINQTLVNSKKRAASPLPQDAETMVDRPAVQTNTLKKRQKLTAAQSEDKDKDELQVVNQPEPKTRIKKTQSAQPACKKRKTASQNQDIQEDETPVHQPENNDSKFHGVTTRSRSAR